MTEAIQLPEHVNDQLIELADDQPKNCVFISPDGNHCLLEIAEDHISFNFPDGRPLIEARNDGTVRIKGEPIPTHNKAIYEGFQLWLEQALGQILHIHQDVAPVDERIQSLQKKLTNPPLAAVPDET